jgi:rhomboid family protein
VFILPIPTHEEFRSWGPRAVVVWTLVVLNAAVFLVTLSRSVTYLHRFGFVPASPTLTTAMTSMFMHGGWLHLIGNVFFLVIFGKPVEHAIGAVRFALGYLLAGLAATALHAALTVTPAIPVVGASGAISGVVGMFLAIFPRAPVDLHLYLGWAHVKTWRSSGLVATGVWFFEQLALALITSAARGGGGIAFWAHVGGFLAGVALGFLANRLA